MRLMFLCDILLLLLLSKFVWRTQAYVCSIHLCVFNKNDVLEFVLASFYVSDVFLYQYKVSATNHPNTNVLKLS